jgi:hypothetical protein
VRNLILAFIFFCVPVVMLAQPQVANSNPQDSSGLVTINASPSAAVYNSFVKACPPMASWQTPNAANTTSLKKQASNYLFYLLVATLLLLAVFKVVFPRYFQNLFKVFFNTTLKQNQLSDQLYLSKLPSLFFNITFFISAAIFTHVVFYKFYPTHKLASISYLPLLVVFFAIVYLVKYAVIKFAGYLSDQKAVARIYIFVIFLINKMLGLVLVILAILLAFLAKTYSSTIAWVAVCTVGLFFLIRYFRAFSLLQYRLRVSVFHCILFAFATEVFPLLIMCKICVNYITKIG